MKTIEEATENFTKSVFQDDDGKWYWMDETWNGSTSYNTYEEAAEAQNDYVTKVLGV